MGKQLNGVVLIVVALAIGMAFYTGHMQRFLAGATSALKGTAATSTLPFPELFRKDSSAAQARLN